MTSRTDAAAGATDGTQAIRRVAGLLRAVAKAGEAGTTLSDVARDEMLPRSTAHRMLKCLVEEGFVEIDASLRYRVGPLVHELGLVGSSSARELLSWRPAIEAVARRTGATAYLMRRSGVEAVCLAKADGHSVVRFVPVEVGQRRLLGVGAGATALLAALPPPQVEEVIELVSSGLARYPRLDAGSLRASVAQVRRTGFAISQGTVVDDGFGMGAAVPAPRSVPHLAVSIAAHASMVTESRISTWRKIISEEIRTVVGQG